MIQRRKPLKRGFLKPAMERAAKLLRHNLEAAVKKARTPIPKRRPRGPRRGRLVDKAYLAWIATQPGVVHGGKCTTVHHVREFGSPKSDRRTLPMEFGYHTYQEGPESIEVLGKVKWQALHGVNIDRAIGRYQQRYLTEHPNVKW